MLSTTMSARELHDQFKPKPVNYVIAAVLMLGAVVAVSALVYDLAVHDENRQVAFYGDVSVVTEQLRGTKAECLTRKDIMDNGNAFQAATCTVAGGGSYDLYLYDVPEMVAEELEPHRTGKSTSKDMAGTNWIIKLANTPPAVIDVLRVELGGQVHA